MKIVELLEWDTNFFGFSVAQILSDKLDAKSLCQVFSFCTEQEVRLLQFRCDAHHRPSILLAEKHNFHFADVRLTLHKKLIDFEGSRKLLPDGLTFRKGEISDIPALHNIVTDLYTHSRYYFDTNFPRNDVHGFYRNWIEKSVYGKFNDIVWILCREDHPLGCCSVSYGPHESASIGLFGIDPDFSGQGLGLLLMQEVLGAMLHRGVKRVSVITQGRNYGAQRLYQQAGFLPDKMEIYYHRWFSTSEEG